MKQTAIKLLETRGVSLPDIAEVVMIIQEEYVPGITLDDCLESVQAVLGKREVQHALLTGVALDMAAEEGTIDEPLLSMLREDDPLYGVDEVLALAITGVYGSIGFTNFGYLDKIKIGIIGELNNRQKQGQIQVNTFLDDIVAGVAAAAAARLAHATRTDG